MIGERHPHAYGTLEKGWELMAGFGEHWPASSMHLKRALPMGGVRVRPPLQRHGSNFRDFECVTSLCVMNNHNSSIEELLVGFFVSMIQEELLIGFYDSRRIANWFL